MAIVFWQPMASIVTMQPLRSNAFGHEERVKNEAWVQILALGFHVLVDLWSSLPKEGSVRRALKLTQDLADPGFVAIAIERVQSFAKASLTMFRAHALKLFNGFVSHARNEKLRLHPTLLRLRWPSTLLGVAHASLMKPRARPLPDHEHDQDRAL